MAVAAAQPTAPARRNPQLATMSAVVCSSVRITASAAGRAPAVARRCGCAPARPIAPSAKSAVLGGVRLPERAARLVVRAEKEGLDRDAPELQEKFAIIGCVRARAPPPSTPSRRETRPAPAHFIHRTNIP